MDRHLLKADSQLLPVSIQFQAANPRQQKKIVFPGSAPFHRGIFNLKRGGYKTPGRGVGNVTEEALTLTRKTESTVAFRVG
jgi:hypothetical protein